MLVGGRELVRILGCLALGACLVACAPAFASGSGGPDSFVEARGPRLLPEVKLSALLEDGEPEKVAKGQAGRKAQKSLSRSIGLPGWWGYEKTERSSSAAFLPFFYKYKDAQVSILHFWPFYGHKKTVVDTWDPILRYVKHPPFETHYVLWPFFRHTTYAHGATQVDLPWPLVQLWADKNRFHAHLLPLLWVDIRRDNTGSVVLFPFFWQLAGKESRATVLFPVYWDIKTPEKELWHLWPIYGYSKAVEAGGVMRHRVMLAFPLLRHTRRWDPQKPKNAQPIDREIDVLWPLIKFRYGPLIEQYHLFPFFFGKMYRRDTEDGKTKLDTRYFIAPPVFWYWSNPRATYFHLWPYGISRTRDNDEKRYDLAWPLLSIHTIKTAGVLEVSVPFYLALFKYESRRTEIDPRKPQNQARFTAVRLFPVFNYRSGPASIVFGDARLGGRGTYWSIFPLVRYKSLESSEGVEISGPAIFPIFNYTSKSVIVHFSDRSVRGRSIYCQLFPLFAYQSTPALFRMVLNPLFSYSRKLSMTRDSEVRLYGAGGLLFSYTSDLRGYDFRILTGLFGFGRKHDDSYIRLFWAKF